MKTRVFERRIHLPCTAAEAFAWHERRGAFQRLTPPWEQVEVEQEGEGEHDGQRAVLRSRMGPVWVRWVAEHFGYEKDRQFCDRQLAGPFAFWEHTHRFEPAEGGGCWLTDHIEYRLPLEPFSGVAEGLVEARLDRMFTYRHAVTAADLAGALKRDCGVVVVSGASGLIGSALVPFLRTQGWTVYTLVRRAPRTPDEIRWQPAEGGDVEWPKGFACDAVIHLAGVGIASGRWSSARKAAIRGSRIHGTTTLVKALARLPRAPQVMLSGSAVGYYGPDGQGQLQDEESEQGDGFLAEVCAAWEQAARPVEALGTRLVLLRTGVVLSPAGGALAKMLLPFRLGLGGPMAGGKMDQSWISLDDWLRACTFALENDAISGPMNLTAPWPVPQEEFADTLGSVLNRPAVLPLPRWPLQLALGEIADEALLADARVHPTVLSQNGFNFLHPSLEKALRHVLGRNTGL
ncbi:TIGR01777 family oxidoreductase [Actomonas aquatica]|uniref:TIGR01777 family oxidoreductase n=1 Tax=Actomonas aquatica TaxID=2866162 RepID=A0ABZ1CAB2_9BACT|nr:TIGR01777 family oxidoreductase [Opitutus sp. WL0086]WRQ88411.1 TIGR01777 family oxidoreductase [Opitutus sp. WL0086]